MDTDKLRLQGIMKERQMKHVSIDVSVSPELMARFNAAVEALDSKAQDNTPAEEQTRVTAKTNYPVDQPFAC